MRRKPEEGGNVFVLKKGSELIEIDNRWIVPFSPMLCKAFDAHINVEFANSIKSIKYVTKYINKGSDMCMFSVAGENVDRNDEVRRYQMGRYISSNEAVWRLLSFNIHERFPAVQHLAVHLENGQRVFFREDEENLTDRLLSPPKNNSYAVF